MSKNKAAKAANEKFKMEVANELGLNLSKQSMKELTARQTGKIGGMMVKKMIEEYKNNHK